MGNYLRKGNIGFREDTCLSFNGGKDCTVVLHLLRAACALKQGTGDKEWLKSLKFVHFVKPNEFPEIQQFREQVEAM